LIRRQEAGAFVTYNAFGKKIFRQAIGLEYSNAGKINMNNPEMHSASAQGKNVFDYTKDQAQMGHKKFDK
jgi:hypothetical protein